jgi:hypothetical protein
MRLRNTNPLGQVDLPLIGRQGEPLGEEGVGCLEPGEVFEVDDALAGREPADITDEGGNVIGQDLGEGLLAQVGNYERVEEPPATEPAGDGAARKGRSK